MLLSQGVEMKVGGGAWVESRQTLPTVRHDYKPLDPKKKLKKFDLLTPKIFLGEL